MFYVDSSSISNIISRLFPFRKIVLFSFAFKIDNIVIICFSDYSKKNKKTKIKEQKTGTFPIKKNRNTKGTVYKNKKKKYSQKNAAKVKQL